MAKQEQVRTDLTYVLSKCHYLDQKVAVVLKFAKCILKESDLDTRLTMKGVTYLKQEFKGALSVLMSRKIIKQHEMGWTVGYEFIGPEEYPFTNKDEDLPAPQPAKPPVQVVEKPKVEVKTIVGLDAEKLRIPPELLGPAKTKVKKEVVEKKTRGAAKVGLEKTDEEIMNFIEKIRPQTGDIANFLNSSYMLARQRLLKMEANGLISRIGKKAPWRVKMQMEVETPPPGNKPTNNLPPIAVVTEFGHEFLPDGSVMFVGMKHQSYTRFTPAEIIKIVEAFTRPLIDKTRMSVASA